jgi:peptide/nickel transport system substrate-binding protein
VIKKLYVLISVFIIITTIVLFPGCKGAATTSTAAKTTTSAKTTAVTTTTTAKPVTGGILRRISTTSPTNIGYPPGGSTDSSTLERVLITDSKANPMPNLCENWKLDPVSKTMTWYVRKGITFSDGTIFDANVLKWNFQKYTEGGRMSYSNLITSYEVTDDYTLKMNLNDVNNQLLFNWGFVQMMSPTAFAKNGADWCRQNAVTTSAFTVTSFIRDSGLTFVKNPSYWMPGLPYLEGLKTIVIPDNMVASGMMQTKDADIWQTTAQFAVDLEKKGLKIQWEGGGTLEAILFDSKDSTSPFNNQLVRQAIEYAINRPDLAKKVGYGVYEAATFMERKGLPGYIEGFDPRPYNVDKAKDLLKQAGLANGFKTSIVCSPTHTDTATAVKSYLAVVGIDVDVNIVDAGLATTTIFSKGWKGMALTGVGIAPTGASLITHFGASPFTFRSGVEYKSPEFLAAVTKMEHVYTDAEFDAAARAAYKQASDDAMAVPLYFSNSAIVYQPYVHSQLGVSAVSDYNPRADWMEAH